MLPLLAAFLLSFIPMWCYSYAVYWLDRFEREPKTLLGIVFLWGALVATVGAAIAEFLLGEGFLAVTQNKALTELAQKKEQLSKFGEERGNAGKVKTLRAELGKHAAMARA